MLKKCCLFLQNYRKPGFKESITTAKYLAEELQIEPVFKPLKRIKRVKRQFAEISHDEPIVCPTKKLQVEFFNPLLSASLMSIKERLEQLDEHSKIWSFFTYRQSTRSELLKFCANL